MDLPSFIRSLGVSEAAELFEVKERTARAWMYRERVPGRKKIPFVVEKSGGKVRFSELYSQRP